jgi:hypothetical protein
MRSALRVAYPLVNIAGFGNNVITLAKAHCVAERCGLTYLPPRWPPTHHMLQSRDGYGHYFPLGPWDRLLHECLRIPGSPSRPRRQEEPFEAGVRTVRFTQDDYERVDIEDMGDACAEHLRCRGLLGSLRPLVVGIAGQWGRYRSIRPARAWLRELLSSHEPSRRRHEEIIGSLRPGTIVAVHIRLNDKLPRTEFDDCQPGERLVQIPLDWYTTTCRLIGKELDGRFLLLSDGTDEQLRSFIEEFQPLRVRQEYTDLLSITLMSASDLVVCSNSSYSRFACFLNDRPYVWCADLLLEDDSGRYGYLWGAGHYDQIGTRREEPDPQADLDAVARCFAVPRRATELAPGLVRYLRSCGSLPVEQEADLLYGHAVLCPEPATRRA